MNRAKTLLTIAVALFVGGFATNAFSRDPQRGRLLLEYPETSVLEASRIHPDRARASVVHENVLNHTIDIEHYSQRVADKIIALERSGRSCETARYLQIKAVYELRQEELQLSRRDLARAEDALRDGCRPPMIAEAAPAVVEPVKEYREKRVRVRRHRTKKCICK